MVVMGMPPVGCTVGDSVAEIVIVGLTVADGDSTAPVGSGGAGSSWPSCGAMGPDGARVGGTAVAAGVGAGCGGREGVGVGIVPCCQGPA